MYQITYFGEDLGDIERVSLFRTFVEAVNDVFTTLGRSTQYKVEASHVFSRSELKVSKAGIILAHVVEVVLPNGSTDNAEIVEAYYALQFGDSTKLSQLFSAVQPNQTTAKSVIAMPEIIVVTLENNDSALFVNADAVLTLDADDSGDTPLSIGEALAAALNVSLQTVTMAVPSDSDWNWADVYDLLPPEMSAANTAKSLATVVLEVDGGVINCVRSTIPMRVVVLDHDTEGGDADNIRDVNGEAVYVQDYTFTERALTGFGGVAPDVISDILGQLDSESEKTDPVVS